MFYGSSNALFYIGALYTNYGAFVFTSKIMMLLAVQKHKHVHKTLWEKGQALQDTEKGLSNKEVAAKYINVKYHIYMGQK